MAEAVYELVNPTCYFPKDTFGAVPVTVGFMLESEPVTVSCCLQPRRSIDEKDRVVDGMFLAEFRATVLSRHDRTCPLSGVDHSGLLDVAHVFSWSDYPEHRADLSNVLALRKTHHSAFDRELFTIDEDYRLCINPNFETQSDLLQWTIIDRAGERISIPHDSLKPKYVAQHNMALEWV